MDGERERIKRMAAEGKISPEQARRLIEALDKSDKSEKTEEAESRQAPQQAAPPEAPEAPAGSPRRYAPLVIIAVLAVAAALLYRGGYVPRSGGGADLLLNGGFETGSEDRLSMWTPSVASDPFWSTEADGAGSFFRDGSVAFSGSHSAAITGAAGGGSLSWRQRVANFPPGAKLVLTGYVKTSGVTGNGASIAIRGVKELGSETFLSSSSMSFDLTGTGEWKMVRVYAVVAEGTREVLVLCRLDGTGTAWFDELKLTAGD